MLLRRPKSPQAMSTNVVEERCRQVCDGSVPPPSAGEPGLISFKQSVLLEALNRKTKGWTPSLASGPIQTSIPSYRMPLTQVLHTSTGASFDCLPPDCTVIPCPSTTSRGSRVQSPPGAYCPARSLGTSIALASPYWAARTEIIMPMATHFIALPQCLPALVRQINTRGRKHAPLARSSAQ